MSDELGAYEAGKRIGRNQTIDEVLKILEKHKTTVNVGMGNLFFPILPEAIEEIEKLKGE